MMELVGRDGAELLGVIRLSLYLHSFCTGDVLTRQGDNDDNDDESHLWLCVNKQPVASA